MLIRTAPPAAGGQDVLLFDFDDLLTMELATPLALAGTPQDVILPLPPWPPGVAALREQYCAHTRWPQGRKCWPGNPPTQATLYALVDDNPGTARHTAALALCELRHAGAAPREAWCRPRWPRRLTEGAGFPFHEPRLPNRGPVRSYFPTSTVRAAYGPASTVLPMELI